MMKKTKLIVAPALRPFRQHLRRSTDFSADLVHVPLLRSGRDLGRLGTARAALEEWRHAIAQTPVPTKSRVFIVAFRNRTWFEWAVFAACYLYRMGYRPVLLYSDQERRRVYGEEFVRRPLGLSFWESVLRMPQLELINLDNHHNVGLEAEYAQFARDNADTAAAYDLRVEEYEGGGDANEYASAVERCRALLQRFGAAVQAVLERERPERIICPSGLISWSLAAREAAQRTATRAVYVEGYAMRPGHMVWNYDRPALQYALSEWEAAVGPWDEEKEVDARDFAAFQERAHVDRAGWLDDFHPVQRKPKTQPLPPDILEFLKADGPRFLLGSNVIGDSSILRKQTIFRSQREWIEEVIAFFRTRPDLRLLIRAHPDEVWARARFRVGDFARNLAQNAPNLRVIGGEEDVSTYALIEHVDAGLAWVSNFGIDTVLRGKPVVLAARAQYAAFGVGIAPDSKQAYFDTILQLAANPQPPSQEMMRRAKLYQLIVFKVMSLRATGSQYDARYFRLRPGAMHPDQEQFYRILVGELPLTGQFATRVAHRDKQLA